MPETTTPAPVEPVDQTNPFDAGHTTSEYAVTKWVSMCAIVVAVLGGITEALTQITHVLPTAKWVGVGLAAVGMISGVVAQIGYALSRGQVKAAMLAKGAQPRDAGTATGNLNAS